MDKKVINYLGNPVISQILIEFEKEYMSAKELRKKLPAIPPATLYRHVKKLYKEEILTIVEEKQHRGAVEKKYALAVSLKKNDINELSEITPQQYYEMFAEFTLGLLSEFNHYAKKEEADVAKSGSGFSLLPIYATADELAEYGQAITKILEPALKQRSADQKLHNFALILTPPREDE